MTDLPSPYRVKLLTVHVNAISAREAFSLASECSGDLDFSREVAMLEDDQGWAQSCQDHEALGDHASPDHEPGGYVVRVGRWATVDEAGKEVEADYRVEGLGARRAGFSSPHLASRSYELWLAEEALRKALPEASRPCASRKGPSSRL